MVKEEVQRVQRPWGAEPRLLQHPGGGSWCKVQGAREEARPRVQSGARSSGEQRALRSENVCLST